MQEISIRKYPKKKKKKHKTRRGFKAENRCNNETEMQVQCIRPTHFLPLESGGVWYYEGANKNKHGLGGIAWPNATKGSELIQMEFKMRKSKRVQDSNSNLLTMSHLRWRQIVKS